MERSLHLGPGYQTLPAMDNLRAGPQERFEDLCHGLEEPGGGGNSSPYTPES
jgi:hypothetical protein